MFAYCHIPKTAGTTLNYILRKNFGASLIPALPRKGNNYLYEDLKLDMKVYRNTQCISGHGVKPFLDYKEYNTQLQWFTFVRDPIKRFVSQYIHQKTNGLEKNNLPIEAWAEKFSRSNWLVKWIAGEENLNKAIEIIHEKFIFIGIVEEFEASLQQMKIAFGIELDISYESPKMVVRDNSLKTELLVDRYVELKDFYCDQNKLDLQFYEYIKNEYLPKKGLEVNQSNQLSRLNVNSKLKYYEFKLMQNLIYKPYVYLTK